MKKKVLSFVLCVAVMLSVFSLSVLAVRQPVTLTTSDRYAESGTVYGYWKLYSGKNESYSADSVYFITKYNLGAGIWISDVSHLLEPGKSFTDERTSTLGTERIWKLVLNPKGANSYGCGASGEIRN